jgi:DNA repair protein RecN (Recombination protein N)
VAHDEPLSLAKLLHEQRQIFADKLSNQLTHKIRHLNMEGAELLIDLNSSSELHYTGCTHLNFKVETNQGEGFHELKDIASGGELSRILLSCRQELATKDLISIFLFDEIDTGMGGETALRIGKALKEVASKSQVIAITHLPQIAHCAEKLIVVSKEASSSNDPLNKRTISLIKEVTGTHKKTEIEAMTPLH